MSTKDQLAAFEAHLNKVTLKVVEVGVIASWDWELRRFELRFDARCFALDWSTIKVTAETRMSQLG